MLFLNGRIGSYFYHGLRFCDGTKGLEGLEVVWSSLVYAKAICALIMRSRKVIRYIHEISRL